ncbi:MAG: GIY-YIG nuclease family protein [Candidatus Aquilonibacter sp.]
MPKNATWTEERIIAAYRQAATDNGGIPIGASQFNKIIPERAWRGKFFARFSDLVRKAGFSPNRKHERLDDSQLLQPVAGLVRTLGRMPTEDERLIARRQNNDFPSSTTLRDHFRSQRGLSVALLAFCESRADFEDVFHILRKSQEAETEADPDILRDGFVYLMKRGKYYKIGFAANVRGRESQLNRPVPDSVPHATIHSFKTDDPRGIEAYWHQRFAEKRREGEYFELTPKDVAAFKRRKNFM